jgi:two-component system LytT family sensor kinase
MTIVTVLLEVGLTAAGAVLVYLALRRQQRGFGSLEQRATLKTLGFAASVQRALRPGLSKRTAAQVVPELAAQAGSPAVALYDRSGLLAFHADPAGPGESHHLHLETTLPLARRALAGRRLTLVKAHARLEEACALRHAVMAPIVVNDDTVAVLVIFHVESPSPAALRIASDLAEVIATQLLAHLGEQQRVNLAQAELRALRAQISPHFLYNSLTTVAAFIRSDPNRARELLIELAEFTRRAFNTHQPDFTSLADELVYVHKYLQLEKARLGERLAISYNIDQEVLNITVPVLVVQPLVENAIKHGVEPKHGKGSISIVAEDAAEECRIVVRDNGAGFDPAILESDGTGALGNVDKRLRQVFGSTYGLRIESAPGSGTSVQMRIPKYKPGVRPT